MEKKTRSSASIVVLCLFTLGVAAVATRGHWSAASWASQAEPIWRLSYALRFSPRSHGAAIRVALPQEIGSHRIIRESFSHPELVVDIVRTRAARRELIAVGTRNTGQMTLDGEFDIRLTQPPHSLKSGILKLSAEARARYLREEREIQVRSAVVRSTLSTLKKPGVRRNELPESIFDFCFEEIEVSADGPENADDVLTTRSATTLGAARAMVALCRAAKVPSRLVTGFVLEEGNGDAPHHWVEVFSKSTWQQYDPVNGYSRNIPMSFLAVARDTAGVVTASPGQRVTSAFHVARLSSSNTRQAVSGFAAVFDLTRLPVSVKKTISLLLLLPLGALATAVMRNILGIKSFGVFAPVLLALSFVMADWKTGLVVLSLTLFIALASRSFLARLRLLMVPRLSIVLSVVVLATVFAVSLLHHLERVPSAQTVILPLVVITMLVEHLSIRTEEDGVRSALLMLFGTFLIAATCYLVLRLDEIGGLVLVYPETHLFTLGFLIMTGRYSGYRLLEFWRFRHLTRATE